MKRQMIDSLYMDIRELEEKVIAIGPYDKENYDLYIGRIEELKKELVQVDDSKELNMQDMKLISKITKLGMDFQDYRNGSGIDNDFSLDNQSSLQISGDEKAKKYRMSIFADISNLMQKLELVDIKSLENLSEQWQQEKNGDLKYSMPEISEIEAMLARVYLKYQLDYSKINGVVPKGMISEIENSDEYKIRIKQTVLEYMYSHPDIDSNDKLELDGILKENDIGKILKNKNMWRIITSQPVELREQNQVESTALTISKNSPKKYLTVVVKPILGNGKNKIVEIPLNSGIIRIPRRLKSRILSASIPEGAEYISNDAFRGCKNMTSISLPKSTRYIGNNAFYGCKKLDNVVMYCDINDVQIEDNAFENASKSLKRFNEKRLHSLTEENSAWEYKGTIDHNLAQSNVNIMKKESFNKVNGQEEK